VWLAIRDESALFAIIALISVPLCVVPIRIAAKKLFKRSRQVAAMSGEISAIATEALQSPQEIQAYNLQGHFTDTFSGRIRDLFRVSLKTIKYQSFVSPVIEVISACGLVAALYFGV